MSNRISIRFYGDKPVRAIWDDENAKWWISVLDIIAIFNAQDDYAKNRNYWKYLKTKLKVTNPQLVSETNQLKLKAPDGKMRLTDVLDAEGIIITSKTINLQSQRLRHMRRPLTLVIISGGWGGRGPGP